MIDHPSAEPDLYSLVHLALHEAGIPHLLVGGHAVNLLGFTRATLDIDFMISSENAPGVKKALISKIPIERLMALCDPFGSEPMKSDLMKHFSKEDSQ